MPGNSFSHLCQDPKELSLLLNDFYDPSYHPTKTQPFSYTFSPFFRYPEILHSLCDTESFKDISSFFFFNFNYTIKDWLKFFLNWVILRNNKTILWSVWFYLPLNTFPQLKFIFRWHFSDKSNCLSFENIQAQYILTWCNYQHFQAAHLRGPKKMLN